jgi:hypothetical protein
VPIHHKRNGSSAVSSTGCPFWENGPRWRAPRFAKTTYPPKALKWAHANESQPGVSEFLEDFGAATAFSWHQWLASYRCRCGNKFMLWTVSPKRAIHIND